MKKTFAFFLSLSLLATAGFAQETPLETARNYMRTGDWDNAVLVLNRGLLADPQNMAMARDLALAYYYKKSYGQALETIKPLLDRDDADVAVYQVAGNVYKALEEVKEGEKMYKKAIRKFPQAGPLYSEYGELLWAKKDFDAIRQWEKGIEMAPNYAGNYYNAAVYYYYTKDKIWALLYGEIFVNMEYLTERATEMKKMLLSAYHEKLYNNLGNEKELTAKDKKGPDFTKAVLETFYRQANLVNKGMNLETLTMIRTRFVLDWFAKYGRLFPYRLFEYHQQLIKEGMFEAYNQWLFGAVENLPAFDQWTRANNDAYTKFTDFQRGRIFKMPAGQYYPHL